VTYTETDLLTAIEDLSAGDVGALTQPQLDALDQYHAGGAEAVARMLPTLGLAPGRTVLDVGAGLGGPARQVARTIGCSVVGVDITSSYVDTARALTAAAGLSASVEFVHGSVTDVARTGFDAAYVMHVQMNVADKQAFFTQIARRLRPGSRLATFEVCRTGDADPVYPEPWSLDGTDSFLAAPADLLGAIEASGFQTLEWVDETAWVLRWFEGLGTRSAPPGTAATLPALLDDGFTRMLHFAAALKDGVLGIHRGAFALPPPP